MTQKRLNNIVTRTQKSSLLTTATVSGFSLSMITYATNPVRLYGSIGFQTAAALLGGGR